MVSVFSKTFKVAGLAMVASMGACQSAPAASTPKEETSAATTAPESCLAVESHGWMAHVNRMPGPGAVPTLIVEGQVTVPTAQSDVSLVLGRADRSAIPVQQLRLRITTPDGAGPAPATKTARLDTPAIAAKYKAVQIVCGDKVVGEITDIPDAM